jgi:hypothetical protein
MAINQQIWVRPGMEGREEEVRLSDSSAGNEKEG